jgi:hypothetical protein
MAEAAAAEAAAAAAAFELRGVWSGNGHAASCVVSGLQPACAYVVRVRGTSDVGAGAWSLPLVVRTLLTGGGPLPPPHVLSKTSTTAKLGWGGDGWGEGDGWELQMDGGVRITLNSDGIEAGGESIGSRGLAMHLAFNAGLEQAAREVAARHGDEAERLFGVDHDAAMGEAMLNVGRGRAGGALSPAPNGVRGGVASSVPAGTPASSVPDRNPTGIPIPVAGSNRALVHTAGLPPLAVGRGARQQQANSGAQPHSPFGPGGATVLPLPPALGGGDGVEEEIGEHGGGEEVPEEVPEDDDEMGAVRGARIRPRASASHRLLLASLSSLLASPLSSSLLSSWLHSLSSHHPSAPPSLSGARGD